MKAYADGYEYSASFDLTACHDSISHRSLEQLLCKSGVDEKCVKESLTLLETWSSENDLKTHTGIPQGPQASGLIAEIVLSQYERIY